MRVKNQHYLAVLSMVDFFWNPEKFQIVLLEFLDILTPKRRDVSGNVPRDTTLIP